MTNFNFHIFLMLFFLTLESSGQKGSCSYGESFGGLIFISQSMPRNSSKEKLIQIDKVRKVVFLPFEKDSTINVSKYFNKGFDSFFFTFYPYQWEDTFYKCGDTTAIRDSIVKLLIPNHLGTPKAYYKLKGCSDNAIYSIYYLEGEWLKMEYDPWTNELSSNFKVELINPDVRKINLYYLLHLRKLVECTDIDNKDIKKIK
jgi:hypothetical protein